MSASRIFQSKQFSFIPIEETTNGKFAHMNQSVIKFQDISFIRNKYAQDTQLSSVWKKMGWQSNMLRPFQPLWRSHLQIYLQSVPVQNQLPQTFVLDRLHTHDTIACTIIKMEGKSQWHQQEEVSEQHVNDPVFALANSNKAWDTIRHKDTYFPK